MKQSIAKGRRGRIAYLKKKEFLMTAILFSAVIVMILVGFIVFENKGNILTILGAMTAIPAARALTGLILVFPFRSVSDEEVTAVDANVRPGSIIYTDVVLSSTEKAMGLAFIVVTGSKVLAVTGRPKEDVFKVQEYLGGFVRKKGYDGYKVTVVGDMSKFLSLLRNSDSVLELQFEDEEEKEAFEAERNELCDQIESLML